ncbi:hypothetical protein ACWGJW_21295 [Streptomyces nigrescens]
MLDDAQVNPFIEDGFVRIDGAFSRETAAECRDLIWRDMDAAPDDPATWPRPWRDSGTMRKRRSRPRPTRCFCMPRSTFS